MPLALDPYTNIRIPRADYFGAWGEFVNENSPFFTEDELSRIANDLATKGKASHTALSAGVFEFEVVKS